LIKADNSCILYSKALSQMELGAQLRRCVQEDRIHSVNPLLDYFKNQSIKVNNSATIIVSHSRYLFYTWLILK